MFRVTAIGLVLWLSVLPSAFADEGLTFLCLHNDKIDPNLRNTIHAINSRLVDSMQRQDPNVLTDIIIDELKYTPMYAEEVAKAYKRFKPMVENRKYKVYTESHIRSKGKGTYQFNIPSETKERFMIQAQRLSEETYVCFLATDDCWIDYMVSVVYSKLNNCWRVQKIHIGTSRISGRSSLGWYLKAQELFEKGNVARAFLALEVSRALLRPSPFMQFNLEKEIIEVYDKFNLQLHTKIYVRLVKLPSTPQLYHLTGEFVDSELVPKVTYVTTNDLSTDSSLRREAAQIAIEIDKLFPGFAAAGTNVLYTAYKEPPSDPNKTYPQKNFSIKME